MANPEDHDVEIQWTDNEHIGELLDVSTGKCSYCGGPARVPEDVAAVLEQDGKRIPFVVCPDCTPGFFQELRKELEERGM